MKEKILLDKEKFLQIINAAKTVQDFPITELKGVPVLKVKPAGLDDQIRARELSKSSFISSLLPKNEDNSEEDKSSFHPKAVFEITIFQKCVVAPEFTLEEVVKISKIYPELINKVCTFALGAKPNFDSMED